MSLLFAAQIAPQRSTQYANLAGDLAAAELAASPLGHRAKDIEKRRIAGQDYVTFALAADTLSDDEKVQLASLATLGNIFELYASLGGIEGPLLRPVAVDYPYALSPDIAAVRRYKGKTNELFTLFLCNMAKFASGFAETPWHELRVFDPLAGGGTTLFTALSLGAHAAGIERERDDVESTATFLTQFCRESRISVSVREERLRQIEAHRWQFRIGREKEDPRRCLLASGDSALTRDLLGGFGKPHLVVTDLPYGIQHQAPLADLLGTCLPGWAAAMEPSGALAFSWDSTRATRDEMVALVEDLSPLRVVAEAPYGDLAHRVDRVIKRRDVIVARMG
jgi:hypothetical protein